MKILVTGGCGFLGRNLVPALMGEGHGVTVLDLVAPSLDVLPDFAGAYLHDNVRDLPGMHRAVAGHDAVVQLAAESGVATCSEDPLGSSDTNIRGTLTVLEACRMARVPRFVLASSIAAERALTVYGAAKRAGEALCAAYWATWGIEAVALRFSNAYGPGSQDKATVVASMLRRIRAGQPIEVSGDGEQCRDFLHVDDLVHAVCLSLTAAAGLVGGETIPIGSGVQTSINELVRELSEAHGSLIDICQAPARHDAEAPEVNLAAADTLLDYSPQVWLRDGLLRTYQWFLAQEAPL